MCAINDPLGQTHIPFSSDRYSHLKFVLFCEILKSGDERTEVRTEVQTKCATIVIPILTLTLGRPRGSIYE